MSLFALTDCTTWIAGHDFTTDSNKISVEVSVDDQDSTVFGSGGYKSRVGGLKDVDLSLEGFWQSATVDAVDPESFPDLGVADRVITVSPTGVALAPAYLLQAGKFKYSIGDQVGNLMPFKLDCSGTNGVGVIRGQVAKARGSVSGTGPLGSVLNLGAPSASQYVYAALHVFGTPGTTITVQIQSDDNSGMTTPTTRGTIGPLTAAGGTWLGRVAGPFAGETYWRMNVSAITGTFIVAAAIAIQ